MELKRKVDFYFKEHNEVIPHCSLDGALPVEVFTGRWNNDMYVNLLNNIRTALKHRTLINRNALCCRDFDSKY